MMDLCGFNRFDIWNLVVNKPVIFVPNRRVIRHKGSFIQTNLGEWGFDQKDIAIYVVTLFLQEKLGCSPKQSGLDLSIICLNWNWTRTHDFSMIYPSAMRANSSMGPTFFVVGKSKGADVPFHEGFGPIGPLAVCSLKDLSLIYPVILAMKFPRWKTSDGLDPKRKDQQDHELVYSLHHFTTIGWCLGTL